MVKNFLTLLLAFAVATQSFGQLSVGFRSGISWVNISVPQIDGWKSEPRLAPSFGLLTRIPISLRLGIQPEACFVGRGYRQEFPGMGQAGYADIYVFDFIDANALMTFRMGREPVMPHLLFGPTVGFMTGARVLSEIEGSVSGGSVLDPVRLRLNRTLFGLCAGAGFTFVVGASHLALEGRYAYGITDIWNGLVLTDVNGATIRKAHGYDRTITVSLAWMMPTTKRPAIEASTP